MRLISIGLICSLSSLAAADVAFECGTNAGMGFGKSEISFVTQEEVPEMGTHWGLYFYDEKSPHVTDVKTLRRSKHTSHGFVVTETLPGESYRHYLFTMDYNECVSGSKRASLQVVAEGGSRRLDCFCDAE